MEYLKKNFPKKIFLGDPDLELKVSTSNYIWFKLICEYFIIIINSNIIIMLHKYYMYIDIR